MTNPEETAAPAHSRRGFVVGILLCVVATAFEAMAVLTAMPAAAKDLGGLDYYAWTFTGFVIAQLGLSPDDAHLFLQAQAYAQNRPMADVAEDILERRTGYVLHETTIEDRP